jgi:hypothetical protein
MGTPRRLVLAALAAAAVLLTGCGSGDEGSGDGLTGNPRERAESVGFDGVHSGELEISLAIDRYKPGNPESVNMRILGTFLGAGQRDLPLFDMAVESNGSLDGREVDSFGGLLLDSNYAVVNYENQTYAPPDTTFEEIEPKLEEAQQEDGEGNVLACVKAAEGVPLSSFAENFRSLGQRETLDGEPVTLVEADLDIPAMIDGLVRLMGDPACGAQLKAAGVPPVAQLEAAKREIDGKIGVKQGQVRFDERGFIRELVARIKGRNGQGEAIGVELHLRLLHINEPDRSPVSRAYAPFPQLLKKVGVSEEIVAQADGNEIMTGFLGGVVAMMTGRLG